MIARMVQPRDYQSFLRAGASAQAAGRPIGMRSLATLLPAPPPAATLWSQGGLLVASALLPAGLWLLGKLDPLDVILLYLAEGTLYGLMVLARILFTARAPVAGERRRVATALAYLVWWGTVWGGLMFAALVCAAPKASGMPWVDWLGGLLAHFAAPAMWAPTSTIAVFLGVDVVRRSDYIDAYLELGARETARYGYVYPMALAFLLGSALVLRVMLQGESLDASTGLVPAAFLAPWMIGWRTLLQVSNLTLPRWGRGLARLEERIAQAVPERQRRGLD
jgi:hypothetical protein